MPTKVRAVEQPLLALLFVSHIIGPVQVFVGDKDRRPLIGQVSYDLGVLARELHLNAAGYVFGSGPPG